MLSRLRDASRACHHRIQSTHLHQSIVDGTLSKDRYLLLLERLYGVHLPFEQSAVARNEWAGFSFRFGEHRRLPLLEQDLAALGAAPGQGRIVAAPLPLAGASFPFLLGYLYVLEGSTLGGQVLCRLIGTQLGLAPESGTAYFYSYGPRVQVQWKGTQALIVRACAKTGAVEEILDGLRDAYGRIEAWLDRR